MSFARRGQGTKVHRESSVHVDVLHCKDVPWEEKVALLCDSDGVMEKKFATEGS
jgi:hypothetical protein